MTTSATGTTTRETGLTSGEVVELTRRGAVNRLDERTSRSLGEIFRANVLTRFNAILGALFVLVMATGSFADGLFGLILVANSTIGIAQEYLAKRKLDRLALLNAPTTRVVRDGEVQVIATTDVVLGDLIELRTGDEVPADGSLLSSAGLELNEANLTGESDPVAHPPGEAIMSGTSVVAGSGRYVARAVGADAYVNKIAADARKFTRTRSEIQDSINTLLKYITWVIVVALPIAIWSQWRSVGDQGWQEVVIRAAAGVVGLVPEGLVLLTSVAFLLSAVQLTRQQVLVQQLPAVEGLARVDVVCLDKTGTLTAGEIAYEQTHVLPGGDADEVAAALGALADDPNANATLTAVAAALPSPGWARTSGIPFNSARKWSAAEFEKHATWVLGAPEMLIGDDDATTPGRRSRGSPARAGAWCSSPGPSSTWPSRSCPPTSPPSLSSPSPSRSGPTPPRRSPTSPPRASRSRSSPATTRSPSRRSRAASGSTPARRSTRRTLPDDQDALRRSSPGRRSSAGSRPSRSAPSCTPSRPTGTSSR